MSAPETIDTIAGKDVAFVQNMPEQVVTIQSQESFGDSGDVFDHRPWRKVFMLLSQIPIAVSHLLCIAGSLLLRGKSFKVQHKGNVATFSIPLGEIAERSDDCKKMFGTRTYFTLPLNMATETSKVTSRCLTPERLKCMFRVIFTSRLISEGRYPATSESSGYGNMIRSFRSYLKGLVVKAESRSAEAKADIAIWDPLMKSINATSWVGKVNVAGMVAGSFSSKEVYSEDEVMFAGCIWWSGVHALMTDVSNKIKASSTIADQRARLENSNFYGDFKRKMIARNIQDVTTQEYYDFLNAFANIFAQFVNTGTMLSQQEAQVIDLIMTTARAQKTSEQRVKELVSLVGKDSHMLNVTVPFSVTNVDDAESEFVEYASKILTFSDGAPSDADK